MILTCCFKTLCRRWFVLGYFSPRLKKIKDIYCGNCDVCLSATKWKVYNVYNWASKLVTLFLQRRHTGRFSKGQVDIGLRDLVCLFMGNTPRRKSKKCQLEGIGRTSLRVLPNGKKCSEKIMMRIAELLIIEHVFYEYPQKKIVIRDGKSIESVCWYIKVCMYFAYLIFKLW